VFGKDIGGLTDSTTAYGHEQSSANLTCRSVSGSYLCSGGVRREQSPIDICLVPDIGIVRIFRGGL
jgi:hypothetical protein